MAVSIRQTAMNGRFDTVSLLAIVLLSFGFAVAANDSSRVLPTAKTFSELYKEGVQAYLEDDWTGCIENLENALSEWRFYRRATVLCRLGCAREAKKQKHLMKDNIEDLHFYEELIRRTLCLMKCSQGHFNKRAFYVEKDVEQAFLNLKPYEYLQVCYYQDKEIYKAASASYTVLTLRPDDDIIRSNLKFYFDQSDLLDYSSLINYEEQSFVSLYSDGVAAYDREDYRTVVDKLEKSLTEYLQAADECRAYCEGSFDQGWFPDITSSYANHFTFCLKCKNRCEATLSVIKGKYRPDFLAKHYNYLQFAYFKLGKIIDAFANAASYLLFYPKDTVMLENKRYYKTHPSYANELFQPREEAVKYLKRQEYETKLLKFVESEFVFEKSSLFSSERLGSTNEDQDPILSTELNVRNDLFNAVVRRLENNVKNVSVSFKSCKLNKKDRKLKDEEQKQFELTQWKGHGFRKEYELGGKLRFSADGFAEQEECQVLLDLSLKRGVTGDGYEGNESPHSEMEHFEGLSLWRLAEMVNLNEVDESVMELFMELCERGRNVTERYFNEEGNFHFAFSQIACRTGIPGRNDGDSWMSHKIHADNCQLQPDGNCLKEEPAYTSNDYSAIIYLNEDFEGGEFIFSEDPLGKVIQSTIRPKCGRIVGFTAGPENKHGVRGVTKGTRCALGLWFTKDPTFTERRPFLMQTIEEIRSRSKERQRIT